jgi:hypothetical protein
VLSDKNVDKTCLNLMYKVNEHYDIDEIGIERFFFGGKGYIILQLGKPTPKRELYVKRFLSFT